MRGGGLAVTGLRGEGDEERMTELYEYVAMNKIIVAVLASYM